MKLQQRQQRRWPLGLALVMSMSGLVSAQAAPVQKPTVTTVAGKAVAGGSVAKGDTYNLGNKLPVTPQEIATIDVLNDICPAYLSRSQMAAFRNGQHSLLTEMMPTISSPEQAVQLLRRTDADYQRALNEARSLASAAKAQENREVCLEVVNYRSVAGKTTAKGDVPVRGVKR